MTSTRLATGSSDQMSVLCSVEADDGYLSGCQPPHRRGKTPQGRCPVALSHAILPLRRHVGGDVLLTQAALGGIPTDQRIIQVDLW